MLIDCTEVHKLILPLDHGLGLSQQHQTILNYIDIAMPIHLRRSERSRTRNSHESQGCVVAFKTLPPQWALWYVSSLVRQTKRDNKSNKNLLFNSIRAVPLWWAFQCLIGSGQCFIAILSLSNCWLSRQFSKIRFGCDSLAQTKLSAV